MMLFLGSVLEAIGRKPGECKGYPVAHNPLKNNDNVRAG
jgi:hypothetical protein